MKDRKKKELNEKIREMYYNQGVSIREIANQVNKHVKTIYRWLKRANQENSVISHKSKIKSGRPKIYPLAVINRIVELKKELPQRSAPLVHKWLRNEFPDACPSIPYFALCFPMSQSGHNNFTSSTSRVPFLSCKS